MSKQSTLVSAWKNPRDHLATLARPIALIAPETLLTQMTKLLDPSSLKTGSLSVDIQRANSANPKNIFHGNAGDNGPNGKIIIHNPRAFLRHTLTSGTLGIGESYMEGAWTAGSDNDIISLVHAGLANQKSLTDFFNGHSGIRKQQNDANLALNDHSIEADAKAIGAHYDHDPKTFYLPWIGPTMMYTSGLALHSCPTGQNYGVSGDTLEDNQQRKINRILHKLNPQPGESLLEIGCGWGNFAIEAGKRGAQVTAITISEEQFNSASLAVQAAGLSDLVKIEMRDFRDLGDLAGTFDYVASIGMAEHVGDLDEYMGIVANSMRPNGEALLHYITTQEEGFDRYLETLDFMQKYIFENGILNTVTNSKTAIEGAGMELMEHFPFGQSYGDTLREWNNRFQKAWPEIQQTNPELYTPKFKKMWEFYLTSCAGAFYAEQVNVNHFHVRKNDPSQQLN